MNFLVFTIAATVVVATAVSEVASKPNKETKIFDSYQMWCVGSCDKDVTTSTTPGAVLMGGGTDTNEAFDWQIEHANGGDFVVLRASGDDSYNDYIYDLSIASGNRLNSVTTILFKNEKASAEAEVLAKLQQAEAVFFAGGDQYVYLQYWRDTDVQLILQEKLANVTVGGTSAGLAVLGNWVYDAAEGSVYSDEALEDPYNKYVTLQPAFLNIPFMETIVTDTHFVTRDRMGRMLTFVARILEDDIQQKQQQQKLRKGTAVVSVARGVGVDEHTALLLDTRSGDVSAVGVGTAYVCSADHDPSVCREGVPLTFKDIDCVRLSGVQQDKFSFASFSSGRSDGGVSYSNDIVDGYFTTLKYGPKD